MPGRICLKVFPWAPAGLLGSDVFTSCSFAGVGHIPLRTIRQNRAMEPGKENFHVSWVGEHDSQQNTQGLFMATQGGLRFGILRSMSSSRSPLVKPSEELKTVYLVRASGPRGPEGGGGGRPERSARKATIFCRSFRRETPELQAPSPSSQVRHAESMENAPRQEMLQSSSIAHNPTLSRAELSVRHFRGPLGSP